MGLVHLYIYLHLVDLFMVNVGKRTIHGISYGFVWELETKPEDLFPYYWGN